MGTEFARLPNDSVGESTAARLKSTDDDAKRMRKTRQTSTTHVDATPHAPAKGNAESPFCRVGVFLPFQTQLSFFSTKAAQYWRVIFLSVPFPLVVPPRHFLHAKRYRLHYPVHLQHVGHFTSANSDYMRHFISHKTTANATSLLFMAVIRPPPRPL